MPMIVTDIAGREPMVILPLEEYEAQADAASGLSADWRDRQNPSVRPKPATVAPASTSVELSSTRVELSSVPVQESIRVEPLMPTPEAVFIPRPIRGYDQESAPAVEKGERQPNIRSVEPEIRTMPASAEVSQEMAQNQGLSMEERFYLEPVEDDGN